MVSIGLLGAFLGGVLSILSPCSAMLLPAFFAYAFNSKTQLLARTTVFFLGLATVLMPLGAGLGSVGGLLNEHRQTLILIGGLVIIALGIYTFLGFGFQIPGLSNLSSNIKLGNWVSMYLLGMVYGFAGFCAGPLLGAVFTTAAVSGSALFGALLLGVYALGMTVPLFILAALWDQFNLGSRTWLRGKTRQVGPFKFNTYSMLAGVLFIGIGVLFLMTNGTSALPSLFTIENQFAIQEAAGKWAAKVSNAMVLLIVAVVIELVLFFKLLRSPAVEAEESGDEVAEPVAEPVVAE
ncbi:cytochrome c biogenesis CcdA family protein [Corynebacterium aquilae]|uniref:cytochrome c biogenesis CcdA family protein n=1 Tax=Corynebacterium aquilae TaxID=203263 RepID=UPI000950D0E0|nr:cytochrome c biogenesis CcdA family protein [Corynebacterium aquilae]